MNVKLKEFINDNCKKGLERNYFFVGSVVFIAFCVFVFVAGIDFREMIEIENKNHWTEVLYFNRLIVVFLNSFGHLTMQHCLLNMLCFSVCGIYLERKIGSFKFFLLVLTLALFTSTAITANNLSINWRGFSGVNYALYFYILIDFSFSLKKDKTRRLNLIIGSIVVALIYVAFCFSGGTNSFSFKIYPYDLITNLGHYTSAIIGLILSLFTKIAQLKN